MPMQKFSTPQTKTDLISVKQWLEDGQQFQPKTETLQKIIQFASTYRITQIKDNQFVEWFLN
jgi:hypothetical protein